MIDISIIIPVYNAEKYLHRSIGSILRQEFLSFELILVDDGSTDSSPEVCDYYANNDQRVVVYHQNNMGASSARNQGIEIAKGKWVIFVDADDELPLYFFDKIKEVFNYEKTDIIFFGNRVKFPSHIKENILEKKNMGLSDMSYIFSHAEIYTPWSKAFNRKVLLENDIRFDTELKNGEDTLFMFQFLSKINRAATLDSILYIHYLTPGSLSTIKVPYELNVRLLNQITELVTKLEIRFQVNGEAKERLRETIAVCIGRFFKMNVLKGTYHKNKAILDRLDLNLYCHFLRPKSFPGKIFQYLLRNRRYIILDILFKLKSIL